MGKGFYRLIRSTGRQLAKTFSRPEVIGVDNIPSSGGFVLASNHASYFDVMCLVAECPRQIRFVTLHEVVAKPVLGSFILSMTAIPVHRENSDLRSVMPLVRALRAGEIIGIFPESVLRKPEESIMAGGDFHPGLIGLARLGQVPVLPAIVLGGRRFHQVSAWLPRSGTPYSVAFGQPIHFTARQFEDTAACKDIISRAFIDLYASIKCRPEIAETLP